MGAGTQDWSERELAGSSFVDERLGKRLRKLVELMGNAIGSTVPLACQDWANTKAAYRFFSNDRVSEAEILAGHFEATRDRFDATEGPILVLQDTTEFTFQRDHSAAVGITYSVNSGKDRAGRYRMHTVCGLLMHSSLAVTTDGLPLGLAAIKFWNRQKFKGTTALKRKINPTRVPIEQKESFRWLENMRQSIALFGAPNAAFMSATARATSTSCSAWPRSSGRISWSEPASTGWPGTETIPSLTKCATSASPGFTMSRLPMMPVVSRPLTSKSSTAESTYCRRSESRSGIRR